MARGLPALKAVCRHIQHRERMKILEEVRRVESQFSGSKYDADMVMMRLPWVLHEVSGAGV